jgi:hypothetical protein
MSDLRLRGLTLPGRRAAALGAVLVGLLLIVGGGTFLSQEAASHASRTPLVGRTTTICTTSAPPSGEPAGKTEVSAVSVREAPGRAGLLTGSTLKSKPSELKLTEPGKGAQQPGVTAPVVIAADGSMASASSAVILGDVSDGPEAGLKAAPCLAPATSHWFSGLGATDADRTDLILSNPDDAQAQVALRFYGRSGRVAVPGSPGIVISGHESRTVSLTNLVEAEGLLSVSVQASDGRVTAVAKRTQTDQLKPAGVDWQIPSASPSMVVAIPGVPEGPGDRQLVVTNPSNTRARVGVQILGFQGPFEPSGAASLDVPPESTATVSLKDGLAGEAAGVKLTSSMPVTGSVIATSRRDGAGIDLAVQSAAVPLIRSGVSAVATSSIAESELILSNSGDGDTQISFEVLSYEGVRLRSAEVVLAPNSTATRRLNSPAPAYVVVKVLDGSSVVGGVVLTQPKRDVAGLATIPLTSPDLASRAPATRPDYSVGQ